MTHDALLPSPALFDVTTLTAQRDIGTLERVALEHLELAPNKRRDIDPESIQTLAAMLARTGQLVPCIGYRPDPDDAKVVLCAGQRRLLAARASHELTGTPGFERLALVRTLIVLLLDRAPSEDEIRRVQAQENAREPLSLRDQQEQFRDCWQAAPGCPSRTAWRSPAPTSASAGPRGTACAASSPSPIRSARASPSAPPGTSSRSGWRTAWPRCTTSRPSSPPLSPPG
jgi:hypothetical protein